MGFFNSIQAKIAAISATIYSVQRVVKILPERMEAFDEGRYAEAFLGEKWGRILSPGDYDDEAVKTDETVKGTEDTKTSDGPETQTVEIQETNQRDPSLQAETESLAAFDSNFTSTEMSYGG